MEEKMVVCKTCGKAMESVTSDTSGEILWCPECGTLFRDNMAGIWRSPNRALDTARKSAIRESNR